MYCGELKERQGQDATARPGCVHVVFLVVDLKIIIGKAWKWESSDCLYIAEYVRHGTYICTYIGCTQCIGPIPRARRID